MRTPAASPVLDPYRLTSSKNKSVSFPESDLATVLNSSSRPGKAEVSSYHRAGEQSFNIQIVPPGRSYSLEQTGGESPGCESLWSGGASGAFPKTAEWTCSENSSDDQVESLQNSSAVKLSTNSSMSSDPQTPSSFRGKGATGYPKSPYPTGKKSSLNDRSVGREGTPVFAAILDRRDSAGTFFQNLRRESEERAGYVGNGVHSLLPEDEWKETAESYFAQEEEYLRSKKLKSGHAQGLRPPSEIISSSTERRYSAVVHQFMQKNGLVTPQPDGTLLSRQADQARPSDPSWASVDQDHSPLVMNKENEAPNSTTFAGHESKRIPEVYTPGSVISHSAESFKLKSLFPPNTAVVTPQPLGTLTEVEDSASPFNQANHIGDNGNHESNHNSNHDSHHNRIHNAHQGAPNDDSASDSSSVSSSDRGGGGASSGAETENAHSPKNDNARKVGTAALSIIPARVRESWRETRAGSGGGSGGMRLTPLSSRRRQTLSINNDGNEEEVLKQAARKKMVGVFLMGLGLAMIVAAIIGLLVLLA